MTGLRRVLRVLLLTLLSVELGWLAVGNAVLATHAVPRLIRWAQNSIDMDYARAYSLWPGDLRVRGYWVRGRTDQSFQFRFAAERVHAQVSLLALCTRTFKASHVRASGMQVAFRELVDNAERPLDGEQLALLPPIPGYGPVPEKLLGPGEPLPLALATHGFWHLDLEDVQVEHVTDLWVQAFHWQGDGDVDGRIVLEPRTHLEYGPSTLTLRSGQVRIGEEVLLDHTQGQLQGQIAPLAPEGLVHAELLRFLSGSAKLMAQVRALHALEPLLEAPIDGRGNLALNVILQRGVVAEGSTLAASLDAASLVAGPVRISGPIQLDGRVTGEDAQLNALFTSPHVRMVAAPEAQLEGGRARLGIHTRRPDLVAPLAEVRPELELRDLHTVSLPPWNAFLPGALALHSGRVALSGTVTLARGGKGALQLEGKGLGLSVKGNPLAGDLRAEVPVQALVLSPLRFDCSGTALRIDAQRTKGLGSEAEAWWAEATLPVARLALQPELAGDAEVKLRAKSGRPVLALLSELGTLPGVVKDLLLLPDLKVGGRARLAAGTLSLSGLHADGGRGHFAGAVRLSEQLDAAVLVDVPVAKVGVEVAAGKPKLHLLDATEWFGKASSALELPSPSKAQARSALPRATR